MRREHVRVTVALRIHELEALDQMAARWTEGNRSMLVRLALRRLLADYLDELDEEITDGVVDDRHRSDRLSRGPRRREGRPALPPEVHERARQVFTEVRAAEREDAERRRRLERADVPER